MTQLTPIYENLKTDTGEVETAVIDMHPPQLYARKAIVEGVRGGFDAITDAHIAQYREYGFLSIENAFTPDEVRTGLDGMVHLIDGGNPNFRGVQFEASVRGKLDSISSQQRQDAVRKLMWFVDYEPRLHNMAYHPKLISLVTNILGTAPIMFQDMGLMKPPKIGREKPWHQDKAYFNVDARERVIGCWIALDEATVDNGCMHLMPQFPLRPIVHFKRRDWQICDSEILGNECVAAPLKPGGLLLFDGLLVHGTPHNDSSARRRAVQFHYHGNQFPKTENAERLAMFGSEGKDVSC